MIDVTVIDRAVQLKKEMDAAYLVFKKLPTIEASTLWTSATRTYNDYCIKVVDDLVNSRIEVINHRVDILTNFDRYKKCEQCDTDLLFPTRVTKDGEVETIEEFVAGFGFVEGFPGWCYSCLTKHCTETDCSACTVSRNPELCSFKEVKKHLTKE